VTTARLVQIWLRSGASASTINILLLLLTLCVHCVFGTASASIVQSNLFTYPAI
jgi:hypothetical protein